MSKKTTQNYKDLRTKMMTTFKDYKGSSSFLSVFASMENINHIILDSCCEDKKTLDPFKVTPANILFHILRIAQRPVVFRELEQTIPLIFKTLTSLVESFAILYSLDLIDYEIKEDGYYYGPKNSIILSIREDEDFGPHQPL